MTLSKALRGIGLGRRNGPNADRGEDPAGPAPLFPLGDYSIPATPRSA